MKLFTFKIPEGENLSQDQWKEVLQRCNARKEMKTYCLVAAPLIGLVPIVPAVVIFFIAMLRWHWSFAVAALAWLGVVVAAFLMMLIVFLLGQNWLLRRLVKQEIQKP